MAGPAGRDSGASTSYIGPPGSRALTIAPGRVREPSRPRRARGADPTARADPKETTENHLNRAPNDGPPFPRGTQRRHRRVPRDPGRQRHSLPLTAEGVPAATPDAPPVSPVVFVSDESRARFPWLPGRVIAGSVWRGPTTERVRVDEHGHAAPWRTRVSS